MTKGSHQQVVATTLSNDKSVQKQKERLERARDEKERIKNLTMRGGSNINNTLGATGQLTQNEQHSTGKKQKQSPPAYYNKNVGNRNAHEEVKEMMPKG